MGGAHSTTNDSVCSLKDGKKQNGTHADSNGSSAPAKEPKTAFEQFLVGYSASKDRPCIGVRPNADGDYEWRTYDETLADIHSIGAYLTKNLGLKKGSFVGTLCSNCSELLIIELACYAYGLVIVPLYDTLGQDACAHIVQEADLKVIFCKGADQVNSLLSLADKVNKDYADFTLITAEQLKPVVDGDGAARFGNTLSYTSMLDWAREQKLKCNSEETEEKEEKKEEEEKEEEKEKEEQLPDVQPDDLAVICYTSGTTGQPKGVMLSNKNLASGVNLVKDTLFDDRYNNSLELDSRDVYFSYLPMAHILERMCQLYSLRHGMGIGFFSGDRTRLMSDLQACRPTFMAAVPKIVTRIYDAAYAAVAQSKLKAVLLDMALKRKYAAVADLQVNRSSMWDKAVLHKLQSNLGGRLRFMAIGGAPISEEALRFAKSAFGCYVVQGFGQTETCGLGLCQRPGDPAADSIGQPMLGCEVKLIDVPDMGYFANSGCGELCIRGPSCFSGYFKQEEKTAETIDSEGWVHTGDVGVVRADGSYRIVDRAKNLFKLAQGEYVAPEKIEMVYSLCQLVDQVFIDGNSEKAFLLGVVVPHREPAMQWAVQHLPDCRHDFDAVCNSSVFKQHLLQQLQHQGKEKRLHGFEQVKDIVITKEPFTPENDLVTPTLKLKRPQLRKKFAEEFNKLYAAIESA